MAKLKLKCLIGDDLSGFRSKDNFYGNMNKKLNFEINYILKKSLYLLKIIILKRLNFVF